MNMIYYDCDNPLFQYTIKVTNSPKKNFHDAIKMI